MHDPDDTAAMPERVPPTTTADNTRLRIMSKSDGRRGEEQSAGSAILVLGMHRSGTSAVAGLLHLAGAFVGEGSDLLPAHPQDNPTGYWERDDIVIAHDSALAACGFKWDQIAGLDPAKFDPHVSRELIAQLRPIIANLSNGSSWLVKDPRLCLLLPQWFTLLDQPGCVVVVRDPREIAASMHTGPRGVFASPSVIALWEKYMRVALAGLAGRRAIFISYTALLENPQKQTARLLAGMRNLGISDLHMPSEQALTKHLDPQLHRSVAGTHANLSPSQQKLYDWLQEQCTSAGEVSVGGYPSAVGIDELLAEFERMFDYRMELGQQRAISGIIERSTRLEATLPDQVRLSELLREELTTPRPMAATARTNVLREQTLFEQTRNDLAAQRQLTSQAQRDLDAQRTRAEHLQSALDEMEGPLNESQRELELTRNHLRNIEAERNPLRQQHAAMTAHVTSLHRGMADLKASWSWKLTAPVRMLGNLLRPRTSYGTEQWLYRWYYAFPGISASRKRGFIIWLHKHATWLTRNTLSYQILEQSHASATGPFTAIIPAGGERRMDNLRANTIIEGMKDPPCISIVMPVYNVERRWLMAAVDSVQRQFYPHWELCIADDASTSSETRAALNELERSGDSRIKVRRLPKNCGIAEASNAALKLASGDYVGLLDNDDEITRDALLEVARTIADQKPDIIYSDEDKIDVDGSHVEAHFKSDFNPDYFLSINYVCHFTVLRRDLLDRLGGFRAGFDGAQDYDLFLRATERGERIAHIPKILYHWRKTASSTATASSAKPKSWDAGQRALTESLGRRNIKATVGFGPYPNTFRVKRKIAGKPLISILIPFRDQAQLLATCIDSVLEKTGYTNYEIIGIDNGSTDKATHALKEKLAARDARVRFVDHDVPFNYSEINNFGASEAKGEHLLLLNNDTEVINAEWLQAMLEHSQRPEVGVVGAKLLYPDQHIQHAGVIVGIGGVAGHAHLHQAGDRPGYFSRAQLPQNLSAVTFACAMTRRDVFAQLGGLNATDLTIAFNDIDYCLRAREAGYLIVYTPFAELYHHESRTRGYEDNPEKQARFSREIAYMQKRHRAILESGDPYYNPNLRLDIHDFSARPGYVDALPI
ncbi:MAG: glycosyltransferase [Gemmatimonadaceae bacterium]